MMQTTRIRRLERLARGTDAEVPSGVLFEWGDGDQPTRLHNRDPQERAATAAGDPVLNWARAAPGSDGEPP